MGTGYQSNDSQNIIIPLVNGPTRSQANCGKVLKLLGASLVGPLGAKFYLPSDNQDIQHNIGIPVCM